MIDCILPSPTTPHPSQAAAAKKKKAAAAAAADAAAAAAAMPISEYEKQRLQNMKENQDKLRALEAQLRAGSAGAEAPPVTSGAEAQPVNS